MPSKRWDSRHPYPGSHHRDRSSGSKRKEPEKQLKYQKSNQADNDSELCFKKLSEFNESLRRKQLLTSTKFQWNHLLSENLEKEPAACSKPEPTMSNDRKVSPSSMSRLGIDLTEEKQFFFSRSPHTKEESLCFGDFRYPDVGETDGFGGFGEIFDSDSSPVIYEKAMKRMRRTQEVIESSYRKVESEITRASAIDSIVDKFDGSGEMSEQKREILHGGRRLHEEDCSRRVLTQPYGDFSGEQVPFHGEKHELSEGHGHALNETPSHDETQQMQEGFSLSVPRLHFGLNGESQVMEQETEIRGSRMCYPKDQNEAYFHCKILQLQQEGSTQHISLTEEVGINGQSPMQHPKKRIIDLREIRETRISTLTQTSDVLDDEILDIERSDEDSGLQWNITDSDYPFCSSRMQEVPQSTNRKSIKQRLGRSCRVNYLDHQHRKNRKQRLSPPYQAHRSRRSIKQRLGPPCQNHNPIGRHKTRKPMKENENKVHIPTAMPRIEKHKVRKHVKGNVSESHKGVHARDDVLHSTKRGRTEPPEDSDEFKQLVHGAYVKFIKALNENPAQRRKYTDKGETKNLKCCVCGSKSEDFVENVSLVMHAFTSRRNRVEHLGLHKALCLLMGWDSMAVSNCLWTPKALACAEALAMKEDLVVWPPVVILHNSSIGTTISDDRIIVSIEEIEAFLRGMGFGRGISKVCRGKPANWSIMVVIFHGTISGLQDAERLHNMYAENKHGRAEFMRVDCHSGETKKTPLNKVEDVLYGYLGVAGDMDKLDFETKSHSVVKSKKEIYSIADQWE